MAYFNESEAMRDVGNSSTTPLSGGATFTGQAVLSAHPNVLVTCETDVNGTLYFDFSTDNVNWTPDPTAGYAVVGGTLESHVAPKGPRYFRVRLINGASAQAHLRLSTYLGSFDHSEMGTPGAPSDDVMTVQGKEGITPIHIALGNSDTADGFGRMRVSNPYTLFDSKQIHDTQALFWNDAETSGGGTATAHSVAEAATTISVGNTTAGTRVRQTYRRFNYQPGKSQEILMTFSEFDTATGITKRVGYFDGNNGLFFQSSAGTLSVVRRSKVTGNVVDTAVAQSSWNLDKLDGTGTSGITLDPSKCQIGMIDFEWLGTGRVRFGFVIDGRTRYCHELRNANNLTTVYMSTPNLPLRYEISNSGTGAADDFVHICSSIISEGGQEKTGIVMHKHVIGVSGLQTATNYAMIGLRLKSDHLDAVVYPETISMASATTNDQAHWMIILNPTVAGSFTYGDVTNSSIQVATGAAANTVTGGTQLDGGMFSTATPIAAVIANAISLGSSIAGVVDTLVLTCMPITNNITVSANINWREC